MTRGYSLRNKVNTLLFSAGKLKTPFFRAKFILMAIKNNKCVKSKYILTEKLFQRSTNTGTATLVSPKQACFFDKFSVLNLFNNQPASAFFIIFFL